MMGSREKQPYSFRFSIRIITKPTESIIDSVGFVIDYNLIIAV